MTVLYTRWRFDTLTQDQEPNFTSRETLFTFKLQSAELLSFWRDFSKKIQNSNFGFIEKILWNFVYI